MQPSIARGIHHFSVSSYALLRKAHYSMKTTLLKQRCATSKRCCTFGHQAQAWAHLARDNLTIVGCKSLTLVCSSAGVCVQALAHGPMCVYVCTLQSVDPCLLMILSASLALKSCNVCVCVCACREGEGVAHTWCIHTCSPTSATHALTADGDPNVTTSADSAASIRSGSTFVTPTWKQGCGL